MIQSELLMKKTFFIETGKMETKERVEWKGASGKQKPRFQPRDAARDRGGFLDSKSLFYIKSVSERPYVRSLQYKVSLALTPSCFHHLCQSQSQFYCHFVFLCRADRKKLYSFPGNLGGNIQPLEIHNCNTVAECQGQYRHEGHIYIYIYIVREREI